MNLTNTSHAFCDQTLSIKLTGHWLPCMVVVKQSTNNIVCLVQSYLVVSGPKELAPTSWSVTEGREEQTSGYIAILGCK